MMTSLLYDIFFVELCMYIIGMFTTLLKHRGIVHFIRGKGAIQLVACRHNFGERVID